MTASDPVAPGNDSWTNVTARDRNAFGAVTFEKPILGNNDKLPLDAKHMTLVVRDSSLMGRLSRMRHANICRELRAALRNGSAGGTHLDVIIRTMQAQGCRI